MKTTHSKINNNVKIYTLFAIGLSTYIFGPLTGIYFLSKNFEKFDRKNDAKNTIKIGFLITLLCTFGLFFIPEGFVDHIPSSLVPSIYTSILVGYVVKHQDEEIKSHLKNNGLKESFWKIIGIGILGLIAWLLVFGIIIVFLGLFETIFE